MKPEEAPSEIARTRVGVRPFKFMSALAALGSGKIARAIPTPKTESLSSLS